MGRAAEGHCCKGRKKERRGEQKRNRRSEPGKKNEGRESFPPFCFFFSLSSCPRETSFHRAFAAYTPSVVGTHSHTLRPSSRRTIHHHHAHAGEKPSATRVPPPPLTSSMGRGKKEEDGRKLCMHSVLALACFPACLCV